MILVPTFIAWLLAQILKCITDSIINKKISLDMISSSGGMPSSHSSTVCALTTYIGLTEGLSSSIFSLALVFSIIVMYDATGVRQETGRQGRVLNEMLEIFEKLGENITIDKKFKTLVGHTKLQVFFGAILGILVSLIYFYIVNY
jgi:hypothetical protein